jgi:hypothetical protein
VMALAERFRIVGRSGVAVKEVFPTTAALPTTPS